MSYTEHEHDGQLVQTACSMTRRQVDEWLLLSQDTVVSQMTHGWYPSCSHEDSEHESQTTQQSYFTSEKKHYYSIRSPDVCQGHSILVVFFLTPALLISHKLKQRPLKYVRGLVLCWTSKADSDILPTPTLNVIGVNPRYGLNFFTTVDYEVLWFQKRASGALFPNRAIYSIGER